IETWSWDFGDGATSHERHPLHIYSEPGIYDVRLTVSGADGLSVLKKDDFVIVGEGPGLIATYFDGDLSGPVLNRIDPNIYFDWYVDAPDSRLDAESFTARWRGNIVSSI